MKVEYIADDGARFDSEEECKKHEQECACVMMFDRFCVNTDKVEYARYIIVNNEASLELLRTIAQSQNETVDGVDDKGFWVWDEWDQEYRRIKDMIYRMEDISRLMVKAKEDYKTIKGKEYNYED